jgi:hypothetical protein
VECWEVFKDSPSACRNHQKPPPSSNQTTVLSAKQWYEQNQESLLTAWRNRAESLLTDPAPFAQCFQECQRREDDYDQLPWVPKTMPGPAKKNAKVEGQNVGGGVKKMPAPLSVSEPLATGAPPRPAVLLRPTVSLRLRSPFQGQPSITASPSPITTRSILPLHNKAGPAAKTATIRPWHVLHPKLPAGRPPQHLLLRAVKDMRGV